MRQKLSRSDSRRLAARPRLEILEDRLAPATLLGLTTANTLLQFDSATPGTTAAITVTGLGAGEDLLGIDYRPATGQLYAVTDMNRLVTLNISGSTASVGTALTLTADPTDASTPFTAITGTGFGLDFNPTVDRLRFVSDTGQNLRINPTNGLVITDGDLNPGTPDVVASAYLNNFAGTTATTLYGLDDAPTDRLVIQNPPNNGTLATVGTGLGGTIDVTLASGFDIVTTGGPTTRTNTAYASLTDSGVVGLYTIDLTTGLASFVGAIGAGSTPISGLAVVPAGTLNFSVESFAAGENGGTATITVTRTGGSLGAVSVDYATSNGSATSGTDFTTATGTVMFADGDTAAKTFTVTLLDDLLTEGYETVLLALSNATGDAVIGARGSATLTIRDNESPSVTLYAVDANNRNLLEFDAATPGTIRRTTALVGLNMGDIVQGIDVRPVDGKIYALITNGASSRLATINPLSGVVTAGFTLTADPADLTSPFAALAGSDFGFDFNPTIDRLRIVSDANENLSVNPANGLVTTQTTITGGTPNVVGSAYTNSFAGAGSTSLHAIDSGTDSLYTQNPAANGVLTLVGALGVNVIDNLGFEINAAGNQAFASLLVSGTTTAQLHSINLTTGAATRIGTIGAGFVINGLTSMAVNDVNLTPTQKVVNRLFTELLGRNADASGLQNLSAMLDAGTPLTAINAMIINSLEYRTNSIQDLYQRYLGRAADAGGLSNFLALMNSGKSSTDVAVAIVGSDEYFAANGATNTSFLAAAFQDLLGRAIDGNAQTAFLALLDGGMSRSQVAQLIAGSFEGQTLSVQQLYTFYLLRTADQTGLNNFVSQLQAGASIEQVLISIVSSPEYVTRA